MRRALGVPSGGALPPSPPRRARVVPDPDQPLASRIFAMAVGAALIFLGAWIGTWSALSLPQQYLLVGESAVNRLAASDAAAGKREIRFEIRVADDAVHGVATINTGPDDVLLDRDVRALLGENPDYAYVVVGDLSMDDSWGSAWAEWESPVVERVADDSRVDLRLEWTVDSPPEEGERFITYSAPASGRTRVTVELQDGWVVRDVEPFDSAADRRDHFVALESFGTTAMVSVADPDRAAGASGSWLDRSEAVWALWAAVPALAFYIGLRVLRRRSPSIATQMPREWRSLGPLLAPAIIIVSSQVLMQFRSLQRGPIDLESQWWIAWPAAVFGTACLTAATGWALGFHWIRPTTRRSRRVAGVVAGGGALLVLMVAGLLFLRTVGAERRVERPGDAWRDLTVEWVYLVAAVVCLCFGAAVLIVSLLGRYVAAGSVAAAGSTVPLIFWVMPQFDPGTGTHLLSVLSVVLILAAVAAYIARWTMPGSGMARRRAWIVAGTAGVSLILAAPRHVVASEQVATSAALATQELLHWPLVFAIVFVVAAGMVRARPLVGSWAGYAAMVVASVMLFRPAETYYGVPIAMLVGLAVLWWTGLEPGAGGRAVFRTTSRELAEGVQGAIRGAIDRRLDREHAQNLAKDVAGDAGDASDRARFDQRKTAVIDRIVVPRRGPSDDSPLRWGGMPQPFRRAGAGALVATIVGIPFALPSLRSLFDVSDDAAGTMTLVQFIDAVVALRFPLYGFAFALLLPMLRGRSAIAKAVRLAITLALSEALVILIPFTWDDGSGEALLLRLSQILAVFIGLGAYFDYRSLRSAGHGLSMLPELYGANPRTVWSSGVVVTLVSAAGSAFFASASDVLMQSLAR